MSFKKKDQEAIAKLVTEMYSEGFFDRFKKKPSKPDPDKPTPDKPKPTYSKTKVMVFGIPSEFSEDNLMDKSELIDKLKDNDELRIYKTMWHDIGRYNEVPIFIPVIVGQMRDYDGFTSKYLDVVGKAHSTREEAIEELNKLAEKPSLMSPHRGSSPKLKQTHLNL